LRRKKRHKDWRLNSVLKSGFDGRQGEPKLKKAKKTPPRRKNSRSGLKKKWGRTHDVKKQKEGRRLSRVGDVGRKKELGRGWWSQSARGLSTHPGTTGQEKEGKKRRRWGGGEYNMPSLPLFHEVGLNVQFSGGPENSIEHNNREKRKVKKTRPGVFLGKILSVCKMKKFQPGWQGNHKGLGQGGGKRRGWANGQWWSPAGQCKHAHWEWKPRGEHRWGKLSASTLTQLSVSGSVLHGKE